MDGFLVIDKPQGVTSFAMVRLVRRLVGVRRVGHTGTLDPLATGVLVVAVGRATRLIRYTDDAPKVYRALVQFGVSTDTYDADGTVTVARDASSLTAEDVESLLPRLVGEIEQRPPAYSAIKLAGRPLYRYAREGTPVEPAPRRVRIDRIDVLAFDSASHTAEIEVACGKGTYIRSIARDLGELAGCGAHVAALRRTAAAGFAIADARTPEELAAAATEGGLEDVTFAPDRAVERWPVAIIADETARAVCNGVAASLDRRGSASRCRAYSTEGDFLGLLSLRPDACWRPELVFSRP